MTKKPHIPPESLDRLAAYGTELVDALNRIDDLETGIREFTVAFAGNDPIEIGAALSRLYALIAPTKESTTNETRTIECATCDYPAGEPEPVRCPDCGH